MLVIKEYKIENRPFILTYSDAGFYIERDGAFYTEAIDIEPREYTETDILIEGEATEEDFI